jgi:hypothetical protein
VSRGVVNSGIAVFSPPLRIKNYAHMPSDWLHSSDTWMSIIIKFLDLIHHPVSYQNTTFWRLDSVSAVR